MANDWNTAEAVLAAAAVAGDKPVLGCDGSILTGNDFHAAVARRRRGLAPFIDHQQNVLIATGRGNRFWIDMVAVWALGAVAVPVNADVPTERLTAIAVKARPRATLGRLNQSGKIPSGIVEIPDDAEEVTDRADIACAAVDGDSRAAILFTSGSTGEPKGAVLPHRSVLGNARASLQVVGLPPASRLLLAIPFQFVSSLSHFLVTLLGGSMLIGCERRLLPADFLALIGSSGADAVGGAPLHARWIADAAATAPLPLRWIMSSGDALPTDVIDLLRERLPKTRLVVAYGLTEVGGRFCVLPPDQLDRHRGSVGRPIPGMSVHVLAEDGSEAGPNQEGEIYADGPCVFLGYEGDPEATGRSLMNGRFRTGDLGFRDESGCVHHVGRADDMFKTAGLKVSSAAVAAALMRTNVFRDAAVLPVAHSLFGHVAHAYCVIKDGAQFDRAAVMRSLRSELPPHQLPARFVAVDEIPRTASGKVDRTGLRQLAERLAAEG